MFHNVSFDVRAGEILGIAGLVGSGRSNIAETIFGVTPADERNHRNHRQAGEDRQFADQAISHGMAFLTEDRKETGCFLLLDVLENMQIAVLQDRNIVKNGFVEQKQLTTRLQRHERYAAGEDAEHGRSRSINLSGGNQQKVLIGRWLLTKPKILILDEPTRGIDVGAKAEIHRLISQLAGQGVAVIMISSEMPEVLGMSDRIMVMHEGRVTGFLDRAEATQVKIMELASH